MNRLLSYLLSSRAIALCALFIGLQAPLHTGIFDDANRAYAEGHYGESAKGYEAMLHEHGWSAPVLYNLANAEMKEGKTAAAILSYERALWLAPGDPDIQANLHLLRKQAGLGTPEPSWYERSADVFSANAWAWLASAFFILLCAALFGGQWAPARRRACRAAAVGAALLLFLSGAALTIQSQSLQRAVVIG